MTPTSLPLVIAIRRLDTRSLRALARDAGLGGSALRVTSDGGLAAGARFGEVRIDVAGVPPMRERLRALSTVPLDVRQLVREMIAEYERKTAAAVAAKLAAREGSAALETAATRSWRGALAWVVLLVGVMLAAAVRSDGLR